MKEKQLALEKKKNNALKLKAKHTNNIIYYGLWQKSEMVDSILEELKGVTEKKKALTSQIRFRKKVLKQVPRDKQNYFKLAKRARHILLKS